MALSCGSDGAWRRPVARVVWDHEVAGSNPAAPISLGTGGQGPGTRDQGGSFAAGSTSKET